MAPIDPSTNPLEEAYNHGMALINNRIQCCYCGKVLRGLFRFQHHLGGFGSYISQCEDVPKEIKVFFRNSVVKEVGEVSQQHSPPLKRRCSSSAQEYGMKLQQDGHVKLQMPRLVRVSSSDISGRLGLLSACSSKERLNSASAMDKRCIGRFFFENGIDFGAVTSSSFHSMMGISLKNGEANHSIPTIAELKGWILEDELNEIENYVKDVRHSWPRTGCSVLLDGWTDPLGRDLINVVVDCPRGPIYLRSADVSPSTKGDNALQLFLENILEEVGVQNVVQIVAHTNSVSMDDVGSRLVEKYRSLFWAVSATHCLCLILDRIALTDSIKLTLEKAKTITKFIYSRHVILRLLRRHIGSHELVMQSKIKAAASFLTLENFLVERSKLEVMFSSHEWLSSLWASSVEGKTVANLIGDNSFWGGVTTAVKACIPLVRAISLMNGNGECQMGFVYETMDQIKETICEEFGGRKAQYNQYWAIIDDVWNTILHSPLHAAGYFLNPRLYFSEDFYSDPEVAGGLLITIVKFVEDKRDQDLITRQLDWYRNCNGGLKVGTGKNNLVMLSPVEWWSRFGSHCPELKNVAVRILSQTCNGIESYGLRRDLAEKFLSSTGRNVLEQQELHSLTYVHYNLKLKQSKLRAKFDIVANEIDPADDWIVDNLYASAENGSDNGFSANLGAVCNGTSTTSVRRTPREGPSSIPPERELK